MKLRITTLSENTAKAGDFLGEWGLSLLIETDNTSILFDSGASISACHNADTLGIDLSKIDKIVLSHGHYDHTGGLRQVLGRLKKEIEIIAHPDIWQSKYSRREGQPDKYVGIPFHREELESLGARFNLTTKPAQLADDIMTTGEVPMLTDYEKIGSSLWVKESGAWKPDKLADDLAIVINTEQGLVVLLGCAHRGAINTLYHVQQLTGVEEIHAVLGGSHLIRVSKEQIQKTIEALKKLGVQKLGLCHCTSLPAAALLAQEFGDRFFFNNTGTVLKLPLRSKQ